jgi:penicillin amidase
MKNLWLSLINIALAILLILFFNGDLPIKNNPLPPLGKLLNPSYGIWSNARGSEKSLNIRNLKIKDKAEIYFDEREVPHVFTSNIEDAIYLQGYLEAYNRLFQMDFIARASSSRLSEVLGDKTLQIDINRLRSGTEMAAENAVKDLDQFPKEKKLIQKYVAGVNAYINQLTPDKYPLEYKLLDFKPERWTIKKTALVMKYMADILAGGSDDLEHTNIRTLLGDELFDKLYPTLLSNDYPIIPSDRKYIKPTVTLNQAPKERVNQSFQNTYFANRNPGIGSNNWAVGPSRSLTGHPILSGDPHLMLGLPSVWMEIHLHTPQMNSYGVTVPGIPGIMIGFNENVAWSETNVGHDIEDLYLVQWSDKTRSNYMSDSILKKPNTWIKEVKVKNAKTIIDTTLITDFGPIKHYSKDAKADLAMRWMGMERVRVPEFISFVSLMQATSVDDFDNKLRSFATPPQNFLFADNKGNISLRVNGTIPARGLNDGRFIEYAKKENLWTNNVPFEELPSIKNPAQGYITSSNQRSAGDDYPYYYSGTFDHFRNKSINEFLQSKEKFTPKNMKAFQGSNLSYKAKEAVPIILSLAAKSHKDFLEPLSLWDYNYDQGEIAPTIFQAIFKSLYNSTFDEITQYADSFDLIYPSTSILVQMLQNEPDHLIFDILGTKQIESAKDIVNKAIEDAKQDLKEKNNDQLIYGKSRNANIYHLTRLPSLSVTNLDLNGHPDCVNAQGEVWGPSWRMVVHLGDKVEAWGIYPGGQSGDPASKYYKNFIPKWTRNEHYKLYFVDNAKEIKDNTTHVWKINHSK